MQNLSDTQLRELARKRVEFRRHLVVFCVINATLWLLWWMTGQGYPWPIWPLSGWGIGLVFHYIFDFSSPKLFSEEEEYDRLRHMKEEEHVAQ
jgi:hypothetical protein